MTPRATAKSLLLAALEGKSLLRRARRVASAAPGGSGPGEIIDSLGRRWSSAKHPRDSKGRFIETGGTARVFGIGTAKVIKVAGRQHITVRDANGVDHDVPASRVTMLSRPGGGNPLGQKRGDKAKVLAEDERREKDPKRGDGSKEPDLGDEDGDGIPDAQDDDTDGDGQPDDPQARKERRRGLEDDLADAEGELEQAKLDRDPEAVAQARENIREAREALAEDDAAPKPTRAAAPAAPQGERQPGEWRDGDYLVVQDANGRFQVASVQVDPRTRKPVRYKEPLGSQWRPVQPGKKLQIAGDGVSPKFDEALRQREENGFGSVDEVKEFKAKFAAKPGKNGRTSLRGAAPAPANDGARLPPGVTRGGLDARGRRLPDSDGVARPVGNEETVVDTPQSTRPAPAPRPKADAVKPAWDLDDAQLQAELESHERQLDGMADGDPNKADIVRRIRTVKGEMAKRGVQPRPRPEAAEPAPAPAPAPAQPVEAPRANVDPAFAAELARSDDASLAEAIRDTELMPPSPMRDRSLAAMRAELERRGASPAPASASDDQDGMGGRWTEVMKGMDDDELAEAREGLVRAVATASGADGSSFAKRLVDVDAELERRNAKKAADADRLDPNNPVDAELARSSDEGIEEFLASPPTGGPTDERDRRVARAELARRKAAAGGEKPEEASEPRPATDDEQSEVAAARSESEPAGNLSSASDDDLRVRTNDLLDRGVGNDDPELRAVQAERKRRREAEREQRDADLAGALDEPVEPEQQSKLERMDDAMLERRLKRAIAAGDDDGEWEVRQEQARRRKAKEASAEPPRPATNDEQAEIEAGRTEPAPQPAAAPQPATPRPAPAPEPAQPLDNQGARPDAVPTETPTQETSSEQPSTGVREDSPAPLGDAAPAAAGADGGPDSVLPQPRPAGGGPRAGRPADAGSADGGEAGGGSRPARPRVQPDRGAGRDRAAVAPAPAAAPGVRPAPAERTDNPRHAAALLAERGEELTWPNLARVLGIDEEQARQVLRGEVFARPGDGKLVSRGKYLSGNVRRKLAEAREAAETDPSFRENVEVLEAAKPEDAAVGDLPLTLGASFVEPDVVQQFARKLMGGYDQRTEVKLENGVWSVQTPRGGSRSDTLERQTWGTTDKSFYDLLQLALRGQHHKIVVKRKDREGGTYVDKAASDAAVAKADEILEAFVDFAYSDASIADRLAAAYSERHRSLAMRDWDDEPPLSLPGSTTDFTLRPHQNTAARRMVEEPTTLLEHVVGAGKTYAIGAGVAELKRLGKARRAPIVVPDALALQWAKELKELYPNAKILVGNSETMKDRQAFHKKATGEDWDFMVFTRTAFGNIPVSKDRLRTYLEKEKDLQKYKDAVDGAVDEAKAEKARVKLKEVQEAISKEIEDRFKTSGGLSFEDYGFDYIAADEAHDYKNLAFKTNMQGIQVPQSSGLARDMDQKLLALREIKADQDEPAIATFATGTPVSNTLAEMYVMQRYLRPDLLEDAGVKDFDSWAATFAKVEAKDELDAAAGGYVSRVRMRGFQDSLGDNLRQWRTFTDTRSAKALNLPRPEIAGGAREVHVLEPTEAQKKALASLKNRLDVLPPGRKPKGSDNHLVIQNDGRVAALDPRLMSERGLRAAGIDRDDDLSSPKAEEAVRTALGIWEANKDRTYKVRAPKEGEDPDAVADSPNAGPLQLFFIDSDAPKKGQFSTYQAMKDMLIAAGVPEDKIAFIQDGATSAEKKAQIQDDARQGKIQFLFGGTKNLGTGTNVQNRLIAEHHLDASWKPSEIEQREGRGIRQGNQHGEVELHAYVTRGTHDQKTWELIAAKQAGLDAIQNGSVDMKGVEFADDVDPLTDYDTLGGAAAVDPLVGERRDIQAAVLKLQAAERSHKRQTANAKSQLQQARARQRDSKEREDKLAAVLGQLTNTSGDNFAMQTIGRYGSAELVGNRKDAAEALGARLKEIFDDPYWESGDNLEGNIAQIGGLWVRAVRSNQQGYGKRVHLQFGSDNKTYRDPLPLNSVTVTKEDLAKMPGVLQRLEGRIKGIPDAIEGERATQDRIAGETAELEANANRPFKKADDLAEAEKTLDTLNKLIAGTKSDGKGKETPLDESERERLRAQFDDSKVRVREKAAAEKRARQEALDAASAAKPASTKPAAPRAATTVERAPRTDGSSSGGSGPSGSSSGNSGGSSSGSRAADAPPAPEALQEELAQDFADLGMPEQAPAPAPAVDPTPESAPDLDNPSVDAPSLASEPDAPSPDAPESDTLPEADAPEAPAVDEPVRPTVEELNADREEVGLPPVDAPERNESSTPGAGDRDSSGVGNGDRGNSGAGAGAGNGDGRDNNGPDAPQGDSPDGDDDGQQRPEREPRENGDRDSRPASDRDRDRDRGGNGGPGAPGGPGRPAGTPDLPSPRDDDDAVNSGSPAAPRTPDLGDNEGSDDDTTPATDEPAASPGTAADQAPAAPVATDEPAPQDAPVAARATGDAITGNEPTKLPDEKFMPSQEQQDVYDTVLAGKNTVIQAGAGTGKTTTLEGLARRIMQAFPGKRIGYAAFGKDIQLEAEGRMPGNTEARTGHSLGFSILSPKKAEFVLADRGITRGDRVATEIGIGPVARGDGKEMKAEDVAKAAMKTVWGGERSYANSADDEIGEQHLPESLDGADAETRKAVLAAANKVWADLKSEDGKLKVSPDVYRKQWALTRPDFTRRGSGWGGPIDVLFIDEAQDTPPVLAKVYADQKLQRVVVGDADQAIFSFQGNIDFMAEAESEAEMPLSLSRRYGSKVAGMGNRFLSLLGSKKRVIGGAEDEGEILEPDTMQDADAILARTNAGLIEAALRELENGRVVGVPKGVKGELRALARTARWLKGAGAKPDEPHPDLADFLTWDEVEEEVAKGDDKKLSMLARIVNKKGAGVLEDLADQLVETGGSGSIAGLKVTTSRDSRGLVVKGNGYKLHEKLKEEGHSAGLSKFGFRLVENPNKLVTRGPNKGKPVKDWVATEGTPEQQEAAFEKVRVALGEAPTVKPDVTVSTAHKSKGLEWDRVRIAGDFQGPKVDPETGEVTSMPDPEELRLAYVAVTRAKKALDPGALAWVYDHTDERDGEPVVRDRNAAPAAPETVTVDPAEVEQDRADLGIPTPEATPVAPEATPEPETPAAEADAPVAPDTPEMPTAPEATPTPVADTPAAPADGGEVPPLASLARATAKGHGLKDGDRGYVADRAGTVRPGTIRTNTTGGGGYEFVPDDTSVEPFWLGGSASKFRAQKVGQPQADAPEAPAAATEPEMPAAPEAPAADAPAAPAPRPDAPEPGAPQAETPEEPPSAPETPGEQLGKHWTQAGNLQPGDTATLDTEDGEKSGYVADFPTVTEDGRLRILLSQDPDGSEPVEVVEVPGDALAGRVINGTLADPEGDGSASSREENEVLDGDMPEEMPSDSNGNPIFPGSGIEVDGEPATATAVTLDQVEVNRPNDKGDEPVVRPDQTTVTDPVTPDGWTDEGVPADQTDNGQTDNGAAQADNEVITDAEADAVETPRQLEEDEKSPEALERDADKVEENADRSQEVLDNAEIDPDRAAEIEEGIAQQKLEAAEKRALAAKKREARRKAKETEAAATPQPDDVPTAVDVDPQGRTPEERAEERAPREAEVDAAVQSELERVEQIFEEMQAEIEAARRDRAELNKIRERILKKTARSRTARAKALAGDVPISRRQGIVTQLVVLIARLTRAFLNLLLAAYDGLRGPSRAERRRIQAEVADSPDARRIRRVVADAEAEAPPAAA